LESTTNPVATRFTLHVQRVDDYEFRVRFDKPQFEDLRFDEPAPLGRDSAPSAARVLAAAVGNCLSASLVFCLGKSSLDLRSLNADVDVEIVRNERRRLRIGRVNVVLYPEFNDANAASSEAFQRCLETFEDFCIVTQSVRQGIDVAVRVEPVA
jgi:uncharacterized OsmC-like protein